MSTNPIRTHHHKWFHQSVFPAMLNFNITNFLCSLSLLENNWERQFQIIQHIYYDFSHGISNFCINMLMILIGLEAINILN